MTSRTNVRFVWVFGVLIVASILYLNVLPPEPWPDRLTIGTATPGGTYSILGRSLARILGQLPDERFPLVTAIETAGSVENIQLLVSQEALGLAQKTTLLRMSADQRSQIRVLADLYQDVVQVLVRRDSNIRQLQDLVGRRVYVGREASGTRIIATEVLAQVGIPVMEAMTVGTDEDGYRDASLKLQRGVIDAAFFASGTPTEAVGNAMAAGCCDLLDLAAEMSKLSGVPGFDEKYSAATVPASFYEDQALPVQTLSTMVHLVSRSGLPDPLAARIVDALYDNIRELLRAHTRAEDIAYRMPEQNAVSVHPGVLRFWEDQREMLLIATDAIDGIYYSTGKAIQQLLEQRGIASRVVHTEGSLQNLDHVRQGDSVALMQYEVALAAYWGGDSRPIYGEAVVIPSTPYLRRLATLRPEEVHAIVRRDRLGERPPTLSSLDGMRVAVGPERSGSRLLADTLLDRHDVNAIRQALPVATMVDQLGARQIDAALFAAAVPSEALQRVLADPTLQLLSVEPHRIVGLGGGLVITTIEAGTYGSQLDGELPIRTVGTQSVLVAMGDLPEDLVSRITRALFEGSDFLGIEGGPEALAVSLPSISLHPGALSYYQERSFLPSPPAQFLGITLALWLTWIRIVGQGLLIPVTLVAACQGLLKVRRDRTTHEVGRRIFRISVEASEPASVKKLLHIRRVIRDKVKRRWWQNGEINKERWRMLEGLVSLGIQEAKEHLERALITEIRKPSVEPGDPRARATYEADLRDRIWLHLENGELDANQQRRLLEVLADSSGRERDSA